jgi:hypothetical protein
MAQLPDFSFKNEVPLASVLDSLRQKRMAEDQLHNSALQRVARTRWTTSPLQLRR